MTRIAAGPPAAGSMPPDASIAPVGRAPSGPGAVGGATTQPSTAGVGADMDWPVPQSGSSPNHAPIDVRALCADLLRWEDSKSFMYADTRGFITTGIGNKLANAHEAISLPWQHKATGRSATAAEIRGAFERVQAKYVEFHARHPDPKASA